MPSDVQNLHCNLQMLVLDRTCKELNMSRFYVLRIEATLFGDVGLVREWGRHGAGGKQKLELHPDMIKAKESLEAWVKRKRSRGYGVRGL